MQLMLISIQLSYASPDRLKRITDLFYRIRTVVVLFNQCLDGCDESNEALLYIVDFLDPLTAVLIGSISYLHKCYSGRAYLRIQVAFDDFP